MTDGTFMAWARAVPGAWAPANGLQLYSIYPIEPLLMTTTDPDNNHCAAAGGYEVLLSDALQSGHCAFAAWARLYGAMAAGWTRSLQGDGASHRPGLADVRGRQQVPNPFRYSQ